MLLKIILLIFNDFSCIKIPNSFKEELDKSINFENPGNYYSYVVDGLLDLKFKLKNLIWKLKFA